LRGRLLAKPKTAIMNLMKEFLHKVKSSVYDPVYYRELLGKPLSYSVRYFFTFIFYVALILTVVFSFASVPAAQSLFSWALQETTDAYPGELEIKLEKGVVGTNVSEPFFIKIPDDQKKNINQNSTNFENFLVIDTRTPFSLDEFKNYKTVVLLTRDTAVYYKNERTAEIQSLATFPNVTVNKESVNGWIDKIRPLGKFIPAVVVLGTFVGLYFFNMLDLLYLFISALLIWFLFWYWSMPYGYKKAYQVGLHALTLPTLVYYVFFFIPALHSSLFFGLIFLLAVIMNLRPGVSPHKSSKSAV